MDNPKISVIVPTYKTAKYLPKCLDSILSQTFQDFEIIIISDGPEEDHQIAEEYAKKDNRITVLKDIKKDLGGARNAGIEIAKGKYICSIDSDDWIEQTYLEKMYMGMIAQDDVDIVQCGTEIVFENKVNKKRKQCDEAYFDIKNDGIISCNDIIFGTINVGTWNKLYKKEIIDKYNIKFPENLRNEDAYFTWAYWMVSRKMYCIKEHLYNYLRRDSSLMAQTFKKGLGDKVLDHLEVGSLLYDFLIENNLFEERKYGFWRAFVICWYFAKNNGNKSTAKKAKKYVQQFFKDKEKPVTESELMSLFAPEEKLIKRIISSIFSIRNASNGTHKVVTILGLKLKYRKDNYHRYYQITGENNKIIIVENGEERLLRKNEKIEGLNLSMAGKYNIVKIYKPYKFINCNFNIDSTNAYIEIKPNEIWGICNLNVRCMFGENQLLKIGKNTTFSGGYVNLDENSGLIIGDDCMFGGHLSFLPSDGHSVIDISINKIINKVKSPIIIGNHVWIGEKSTILKNANIKSNSIVAASSVVTGEFCEENIIAAGNPAKIIKRNCTWDRISPFYLEKVLNQEK